MTDRYWFDTLSKGLSRAGSRRATLQVASTLIAGQFLGDALATAAKQHKHKKKHHGSGKKDKGKSKIKSPPCSGGACAAESIWVGNQKEIDHCEFICRQCDGDDPREFCIVDGTNPDGTATKVADCCQEGESCCGECCPSHRHCCGGQSCCAGNLTCCGSSCGPPPNDPDLKCCNGGLFRTSVSPEHCGGCNHACSIGELCQNAECVSACGSDVSPCAEDPTGCCLNDLNYACCPTGCQRIDSDPNHCGSCGNVCPPPQQCIEGTCVCDPDGFQKYCPVEQLCIPSDYSCCNRLGDGCPPGFKCCGSGHNQCCPI